MLYFMKNPALLIYDGDCAFCKSSLKWAINNLSRMPRYVAYQKLDLSEYSLSLDEVKSKVWVLLDNQQLGGHRAVAWLFSSQLELRWRVLGSFISITSPVSGWIYNWIAKNRHLMPGGTKECTIDDRP
jgi:predicted DCC family thiol-disulfide oxidoreductase YuxK